MNIQIIDRSKGKLWLAVHHLKDIVAADIGLHLSPSIHVMYRPLWDLLQARINFAPISPASLTLIFIEDKADLGAESGQCLYFPLAPLSHLTDERLITGSGTDGLPHRRDMLDMLLRRVSPGDFSARRILISAGPTAEDIDPVRFLTNRSTGKMGIALARAAYIRGADVRIVCGPMTARPPAYLKCQHVRSAAAMFRNIRQEIKDTDIFISSAAVADYTPHKIYVQKLKKGTDDLSLDLQRTTDILSALREIKKNNQFFVGFSVETENLHKNSHDKLERKGLDLIVANNPGEKGAGFAGDTNRVMLISAGKSKQLPLLSKFETANYILDYIKRHANPSK